MRRPTIRPRRLLDITRAYDAFVGAGFPIVIVDPAFGTLLVESLQVARDVDRTNWLTVDGLCKEGVAAGYGDVPDLTFIRTTANRNYPMSFNEALVVIRALRAWGLLAWANWGRLKDLAAAAISDDELRAIDVSEGYP